MITAQISELAGSIRSFKVAFSNGARFLGETPVMSRPAGNLLIDLILPLLHSFEN